MKLCLEGHFFKQRFHLLYHQCTSMSVVVYIEFDKSKFKNVVECEKYLRQSQEYDSLIQSRKWKLKTVARSVCMSTEPCAVFRWSSATLPYVKSKIILRPDPGVYIEKSNSNEYFEDVDLPPKSREFQQKIRDEEVKRAVRDQKRLDKEEERRQKKRKKNGRSESSNKALKAAAGLARPLKKNRIPKKKPEKVPVDDLPDFELTKEEEAMLTSEVQPL